MKTKVSLHNPNLIYKNIAKSFFPTHLYLSAQSKMQLSQGNHVSKFC